MALSVEAAMRLMSVVLVIVAFAGLAPAQETNFAVGPQYLITNGSPITLRPIATPSLSLGEARPFEATVGATETPVEESPTVPSAPSDTFLGSVYWGEHKDAVIVGRRLETPSMTPTETALYMEKVTSIVYGPPTPSEQPTEAPAGTSVIEIAGSQLPLNLPSSILDWGVTGASDAQSLTARGYGIPLGDVAAYWKSHKRTAAHVFTNSDLRPRG